ncbi:glycosyl hydrolase 115 family protein [Sediminibacterium soli]|uniref:glycosyl hydrolase 115 family protein n=1 Tax=Sediminibacterium soli TaxID=2698829 RepID=UPI00137AA6B9|nr:glycosyl hydrolase 115 family protein [Sediminibacterium soli]NCI45740.1 glycosyhydrolase [Sediminibacterium soli]
MLKKWIPVLLLLPAGLLAYGQQDPFISSVKNANNISFTGAVIVVDDKDDWLVNKAAALLQTDIEAVTGSRPVIKTELAGAGKTVIVIGTINGSAAIRQLTASGKFNTAGIRGKWEACRTQVLANPLPDISNALVIAGNDKRGTAYGVFTLSQQLGVSPWYWWADVPVKQKREWFVDKSWAKEDAPAVKYRGIFINDEAPAFSGWTREKFGGFNARMYEHMFELILRLRGNYLWPAMWGNAFNDDDTSNPVLADKYGIVMGTSHHEPMQRAQQEWKKYGRGAWNYQTNDSVLRAFWKKGIRNMGTHESIVTIGMRGDGDMPMTQGSNIALLERIVADQRQILSDVTGKPASETPQLWALYKEVQDYYDKGMRVPDDVTLLLCDDNWGNIRKLPKTTDAPRKGGYGIYYHFDYVGGPRNYKWLNTNPIARTWEQMHLAYEYGVRNIWIVNVGDLKPMEFPVSFFLDYAWAPDRIGPAALQAYTKQWAAKQFGPEHAAGIAEIISGYTKYNGRRKPELLDANTYSLENYNEAENATRDYQLLLAKAEKIAASIPAEYRDAYFELVLHPVKACANLQEMYYHAVKNKWYAAQGSIQANQHADKVKQLYLQDSLISLDYHRVANGKWNHMMDQTHIGYTYWQQPNTQRMPAVSYVEKGNTAVGPRATIAVTAQRMLPKTGNKNSFYQQDGYVSIEADHYSKAVGNNQITWQALPDHGKTGSAITTLPVTAAAELPGSKSPHLEYEMYLQAGSDSVKVMAYFSPTLNFHREPEGLRYAVSIDDEIPQVISINKDDSNERLWNTWVANNIIIKTTRHAMLKPGRHVLKFWRVSPAVVLQKLVIVTGEVKQSYLGPPETRSSTK